MRMSTRFVNGPHPLGVFEALIDVLGPVLGRLRQAQRADELIELRAADGRRILADAIERRSVLPLLRTWRGLRARARQDGAVPVVVVPALSRSLRQVAEDRGINWVDLAGNAHIVDAGLLVHVVGRRPRRPRRAGGVDPFTPASANVVRQLMADPQRPWRQKQLVEATGLSQPQTSKVLGALRELSLVHIDEGGQIAVEDAGDLLDAWSDAYRYGRQRIVLAHMSGDGLELADAVHGRLRTAGVAHWFTGLPAAWAYDRFARFRLVSVFVAGDPEKACRESGLRETGRGANVHLIATGPQRVDIGATELDALPVVHPAQVYVDLLGLPERADEAAEHLRPLALQGRRA